LLLLSIISDVINNDLSLLVVCGIIAMLTLVGGIILFVVMHQRRVINHQLEVKSINEQKQQELTLASIQGEENERNRIASELHDDVGATLASVRLFLHAASNNPSDLAIIGQTKELLDESIKKVRSISHELQPSTLQRLGLQTSLQSLAENISAPGIMSMLYQPTGTLPRMDDNTELAVYRIIQELVNNVIKHSEATTIHLKTLVADDNLNVILAHNGVGLTEEMYRDLIFKKGAIGLKNIENRLKAINGAIQFLKEEDIYMTIITTNITHQNGHH
jgi:two-component system NarL family sensor kinase